MSSQNPGGDQAFEQRLDAWGRACTRDAGTPTLPAPIASIVQHRHNTRLAARSAGVVAALAAAVVTVHLATRSTPRPQPRPGEKDHAPSILSLQRAARQAESSTLLDALPAPADAPRERAVIGTRPESAGGRALLRPD